MSTTDEEAVPASWESMEDAWGYLKSQGWTEAANGVLKAPPKKLHKHITSKEYEAVDYLCDEWDWDFFGVPVSTKAEGEP
jgi:hypothetical protein